MKYNDNSIIYVTSYTGPEPVSVDDVKRRLNMKFDTDGAYEFTEDDVLISDLIVTARKWCEDYAGIAIREQTIVCELRNECGGVVIPYGPVNTITTSVDVNGAALTLSTSGGKWKQIISPVVDYIKLTYTAGYALLGVGYSALPVAIKDAIIAATVKMYIDRGDSSDNSMYYQAMAEKLLAPYNKKSWLT